MRGAVYREMSKQPFFNEAQSVPLRARDYSMACRSAQLEIHSCLYNNVFAEEGAEQLLECCCCSQDAVWWVSHPTHPLVALPQICWSISEERLVTCLNV